MGSAVLVSDIHVFQPFGLDKLMAAVRSHRDEIGLVVPQIANRVRVLNCKTELLRELCEAKILLAARPGGFPTDSDFKLVESPVPTPRIA